MKSLTYFLYPLTLFTFYVGLASSPPFLTKRGPTCQNITLSVTISSNDNARLPPDFGPAGPVVATLLSSLVSLVFDLVVEGTFDIAASYCEPEVHIPSRANTLQLLVHGATYDRNYWSGEGAPGYGFDGDKYSWVAYASQQGYPTLAIDRLGYGESEHPDPILVVQFPASAEVSNAVAQLAKQGASPLPRAFDKVVYVGHSFGSIIGNVMNAKYPDAVDATILTGWTDNFVVNGIPVALLMLTLPAQVVEPARFGHLPVGYLEVTSEPGDINAFFYKGTYDPQIQVYDFAHRGTLSLGEILTFPFVTTAAPNYKKPVFVITGKQDNIFCNPTAGLLPANCGTGPLNILATSKSLYPAASIYDWYVLPNAGHCWQIHYAAQEGFKASHDWLACIGF